MRTWDSKSRCFRQAVPLVKSAWQDGLSGSCAHLAVTWVTMLYRHVRSLTGAQSAGDAEGLLFSLEREKDR